jgi:hypothetical protein
MLGKVRQMKSENDNAVSSINEGLKARAQNLNDWEQMQHPSSTPGMSSPKTTTAPSVPHPKAQYGDKPGEQRINTEEMTKPLGLKKGAKIKKTRIVRVHAKEAVLTKSKTKTAGRMGLLKGLQTV